MLINAFTSSGKYNLIVKCYQIIKGDHDNILHFLHFQRIKYKTGPETLTNLLKSYKLVFENKNVFDA